MKVAKQLSSMSEKVFRRALLKNCSLSCSRRRLRRALGPLRKLSLPLIEQIEDDRQIFSGTMIDGFEHRLIIKRE